MSEKRRGHNDNDSSNFSHSYQDYPPFSRLFVICNKYLTEDDFREHFSKFGTIEDVWFVKDRATGEKKGISYIQFSKTSEAARALEAMDGKTIGNTARPIKVMVASNKCEGPVRDNTDIEKYVRLFVMIPKTMSDSELNDEFGKFGKIESANVIRDRETRDNKGYGYVKYKYFSDAARAFENADKKFKAIFAEPKRNKTAYDINYDLSRVSSFISSGGSNSEEYTKLSVVCNPVCQQNQIWKLFDIVPGLEYCHYKIDDRRHMGVAQVVFANHLSAKYAKEKLHGLEYPPGSKLNVRPEYDNCRSSYGGNQSPSEIPSITANMKAAMLPGVSVAQLAETIAQATSLIQAVTAGTFENKKVSSDESFCSVKLPTAQPLASIDAAVAQRCFLVCHPHPPPINMLRDAFSRFGDLIDVYTLPHKNVGFVKYASIQAAQEARKILHGAEICGIRIKVLEAEEPRSHSSGNGEHCSTSNNNSEDYDDRRKRLKTEENES